MDNNVKTKEQTQKNIIDACWKLLERGSPLSISAIMKTSGYHRSTFYQYFESLDDLISTIEEELLNELQMLLNRIKAEGFLFRRLPLEPCDVQRIAMFAERAAILLSCNRGKSFLSRSQRIVLTNAMEQSDYDELSIIFSVGVYLGALTYWAAIGKPESLDQFLERAQQFVNSGLPVQ